MDTIEFKNQKAPKSKTILNIVILLILLFLIFLNGDTRKGIELAMSDYSQFLILMKTILIGGPCIAIISYLFFFKKIHNTFSIDNQGINLNNRKVLWNDVKNWHMLGDSQDERTGLGSIKKTGGFDIVNPYIGMNIFVIKTKSGFLNKTVRLQLSQDRCDEFTKILKDHNLERETKMRMYLTNISPLFILLFLIPFGLMALVFIWGAFMNR